MTTTPITLNVASNIKVAIARRPMWSMQCYDPRSWWDQAINKPCTFVAVTTRALWFQVMTIVAVVVLGAGLDVMEVDAAQYAGMARDMLRSGEYLELHYRGNDYLDKPPLLFWSSAMSFAAFGVHDWSYRLPSLLFAFLGMFATYRFTRMHHGHEVAGTAAVMFGCSTAFFLMCTDVRCDTLLTGSVITAIWLGVAWVEEKRWWQLVGCALALAAGLLAKGPIGLMVPVLAIGGQLLFSRGWRRILDARVLVAPAVLLLALAPMCIGLYEQFGWHGLRFYFWEQSFGRITGENRWEDDSTVLFFTHELPWQLLPWSVFVLAGIWCGLRSVILRKPLPEHASLIGSVLAFFALSLSHFKLPHYLYVVLPLFAVIGARAFHGSFPNWLRQAHLVLVFALWSAGFLIAFAVFPEGRWPFVLIMLVSGALAALVYRRATSRKGILQATFVVMIGGGLVLNGHFYPNLLHYQANAKAGQWAAQMELGPDRFFGLQVSGTAMDYYAGYPVPWLSDAREARLVLAPGVVVYTDAPHRKELIDAGLVPEREVHLENFPAQRLSFRFLDTRTRAGVLEDRFLLLY